MNTNLKVLYIFANERKKMEQEWREGKMPDTYFIGLNYLKDLGIKAEYIENRFINFIRNRNFNLVNIFLLLKIRKYDVVFSGSSLMIVFLAKIIFRFKKPKFIWYNTFFTNLIKRNEAPRSKLRGIFSARKIIHIRRFSSAQQATRYSSGKADKTGFKKWMIRKTIGALDAVICPSQAQKAFLVQEGFREEKIFFIPTGVDVDFIVSRQEALPTYEGEKYILAVGRDMGRDYKMLIEAVEGLGIKLKIAALPRNFIGLNLNDLPGNVEFLGFVPFNKLVELYKNAEFAVIATKKENDFDGSDCSGHLVMLDAMASGKAIIASYRSTINDYIKNGQEGILVEPENIEKLREAIKRLSDNPQLAKEMGKRAYEKASRLLTTRIFAENLAKVFIEII